MQISWVGGVCKLSSFLGTSRTWMPPVSLICLQNIWRKIQKPSMWMVHVTDRLIVFIMWFWLLLYLMHDGFSSSTYTGVVRFTDELGSKKTTQEECFTFAGLTTYGSRHHMPTYSWPWNPLGEYELVRGGERGGYLEVMPPGAKSISDVFSVH